LKYSGARKLSVPLKSETILSLDASPKSAIFSTILFSS